jgi:hypothetical protein
MPVAARIADRNRTEFYRLLQKHDLVALHSRIFKPISVKPLSLNGDRVFSLNQWFALFIAGLVADGRQDRRSTELSPGNFKVLI